jgi:YVTN family beta-propeller protein
MGAARSIEERKTVALGRGPHRFIGYARGADRIWVSNGGDTTITVLDGTSGDAVATVEVGRGPQHLTINEDTLLGYVALHDADAVAVVDARANRLVGTIPLPPGSRPGALVPAFHRGRVYTLNEAAGTVSEIDVAADTVTATVAVGRRPGWGLPHHTSRRDTGPGAVQLGKLYIVDEGSDDVAIVDERRFADAAAKLVRVGRQPARIALYPERRELYVMDAGDDTVSLLDIPTETVVATIPVGVAPFRMQSVLTYAGRDHLWVLNHGSAAHPEGIVSVVEGRRRQVVQTIAVCDRPAHWVVKVASRHFYVTSATKPELCVVDIPSAAVLATVPLSGQPVAGAFSNSIFSRAGNFFVLTRDESAIVTTTL